MLTKNLLLAHRLNTAGLLLMLQLRHLNATVTDQERQIKILWQWGNCSELYRR